MSTKQILSYYTKQSRWSDPGRHAELFDALPDQVEPLMDAIQHLMIYDVISENFYGVELSESRQADIHIRSMEQILDRVMALDNRPLCEPRPGDDRIAGRCRDFVLMLISALRHKGVAARARTGFGAYFNPGFYEDHWVCEYWDPAAKSWKRADPQFDDVWKRNLQIRHDVNNVPQDQFLVAADAWQACRNGTLDPDAFGIEFVGMRGLWFMAGSLVHDLAALNKEELLPWDVWGAQPQPEAELDGTQLAYFDGLATLTRLPDQRFTELQKTYHSDTQLQVPPVVFNALTQTPEEL